MRQSREYKSSKVLPNVRSLKKKDIQKSQSKQLIKQTIQVRNSTENKLPSLNLREREIQSQDQTSTNINFNDRASRMDT